MKIAFIGLGNMGGGMAANQAKAGREVTAFDLSTEAPGPGQRRPAARPRPRWPRRSRTPTWSSPCCPPGPHVRKVYAEQVIGAAPTSALLIDCSTIDVDTARKVAALAQGGGLRASPTRRCRAARRRPTPGRWPSWSAATRRTSPGSRRRWSPCARITIRAGDHGAGQAAKICNNMLLGISMIGTCEAIALAEKLGLEPERFFEIASKSSGQCWSVTSYYPWPGPVPTAPSNRGYEGGFATAMMLKDLKLAQDAAAKAGASHAAGRPGGGPVRRCSTGWATAGGTSRPSCRCCAASWTSLERAERT